MPARSIVVRKFRSFAEAEAADVEEDASRSIEEKLAAVEELRRRAYGEHYADAARLVGPRSPRVLVVRRRLAKTT